VPKGIPNIDSHLRWTVLLPSTQISLYVTSPKVAGSIPNKVIGFFIWPNTSGPGVNSASNRNEYQESFWELRAPGAWGWQIYHHLWADCLENVGASTSHNRMGVHGLLQGQHYHCIGLFLKVCLTCNIIFEALKSYLKVHIRITVSSIIRPGHSSDG
jgi:hypothetical protein